MLELPQADPSRRARVSWVMLELPQPEGPQQPIDVTASADLLAGAMFTAVPGTMLVSSDSAVGTDTQTGSAVINLLAGAMFDAVGDVSVGGVLLVTGQADLLAGAMFDAPVTLLTFGSADLLAGAWMDVTARVEGDEPPQDPGNVSEIRGSIDYVVEIRGSNDYVVDIEGALDMAVELKDPVIIDLGGDKLIRCTVAGSGTLTGAYRAEIERTRDKVTVLSGTPTIADATNRILEWVINDSQTQPGVGQIPIDSTMGKHRFDIWYDSGGVKTPVVVGPIAFRRYPGSTPGNG
jgi:hypothetical protein